MPQDQEFFKSLLVQPPVRRVRSESPDSSARPAPADTEISEAIASLQATTDSLLATNARFRESAARHQAIFSPPPAVPPAPAVIQGQVTPSPAAPQPVTRHAAGRTSWKSNFARWFTLQPTVQAVTPPKAARSGWQSDIARWFLACTGTIVLGIIVAAIGASLRTGPYGENSNAGLIGLGVVMIVAPILFGIIAGFLAIVSESSQRHAAWLAQHTPEQQAQIRAAERAALWAGTAVAAVALHEHNKHNRQKAAAAQAADHAAYAAQRQHRELIDAIQAQQPPAIDPQTASTQRMLAQSAANRNNRGWS